MRKALRQKQYTILTTLFFLFIGQSVFSQLTNFTLSVTKTDESCSGNGSLFFATSNTTPNATLVYSIYLLPNTSNPIGVTTSNSITGLVAGTYRVVALQSLGSLSNSKQQDIQILNIINPLSYQLSGQPIDCINGTITVNVNQGNPATYEIIAGPELVAPQTSNVFVGLVVGEYVVRVNDVCGDGIVQTFTLSGASTLAISPLSQSCIPDSCLQTNGRFSVSTAIGSNIFYPLLVETTIFPPNGGTPVVTTQTITSGNNSAPDEPPSATVNLDLAIVNDATYSYTINVTDACGNHFTYSGSELVRIGSMEFSALPETDTELSFLRINTCNLVPPYYVNFIEAPAGFNPVLFNAQHPGPFTSSQVVYFSTPENQLPFGEYQVEITDSCGKICTGEGTLGGCAPDISAAPICATFGLTKITRVETLFITSAPVGFNFPLPYDCSPHINNSVFLLQLPLGAYTFEGISTCLEPFKFPATLELPTYTITAENEEGCQSNTGTITIKYGNLGLEIAIVAVKILAAPDAFLFPVPFDASTYILPTNEIEVKISGLPSGNYQLEVTDVCGNVYPLSITVPLRISTELPTVSVLRGCTDGFGSMSLYTPNRKFAIVKIMTAPTTYSQTLPYDVSFNISPQGRFYMNELPEGNYTFMTTDICGITSNFNVEIPGYSVIQNEVSIVGNCGSFNLILSHVVEQPYVQIFWLQKLNPITNQWTHPYTGVPYLSGDLNTTNSLQVLNFITNFNIALFGKFRVVKVNSVYNNGNGLNANCPMVVIKEFEFTADFKVLNATRVLCSDGSYNTFITVSGIPPFTFKITSKDGVPLLVDNGSSNYFSGLTTGTYNFQIEDSCGNVLNRVYDIATLLEPAITQRNLCDGQLGQLTVPAVGFLSYQWWNGNAPNVILSTTNTLNFNPFLSSTNAGTYFVRIFSTSSLSCLDKIISYTIPMVSNPQAGNDKTISFCGNPNPIDLFSLLEGSYDTTGSWEELSNSGMLNGNTWIATNVAMGTYQFKYLVNGFCDEFDEAIITIDLNEIPDTPFITSNTFFCLSQPFELQASPIFNASYQWTGPNGFTASVQNPIIENPSQDNAGLYTVMALLDGCMSTNSMTITGEIIPDFDLKGKCNGTSFTVDVIPNQNSFDVSTASYLWTGPDNFTSSQNPIDITGMRSGQYTVTVTNVQGCSLSKNIQVGNTVCNRVPLGISPNNDGSNESFDLTGFGAEIKFKIFNRYGTMVYEQNNYTNQWHGQDYNDHQLPDATYFYYIQLKSGEEKTGWVYVTR